MPVVSRAQVPGGIVADSDGCQSAAAGPERNLVLGKTAVQPLPPLADKAGTGAAPGAGGAARILVANVDNEDQARQVQQQAKEVGVVTHWEAISGAPGGAKLGVFVDSSAHSTDQTLTLLRGLGLAPTLERGAATPAP